MTTCNAICPLCKIVVPIDISTYGDCLKIYYENTLCIPHLCPNCLRLLVSIDTNIIFECDKRSDMIVLTGEHVMCKLPVQHTILYLTSTELHKVLKRNSNTKHKLKN